MRCEHCAQEMQLVNAGVPGYYCASCRVLVTNVMITPDCSVEYIVIEVPAVHGTGSDLYEVLGADEDINEEDTIV